MAKSKRQRLTTKSHHHRLPRSQGGTLYYPPDNILPTTVSKHRAFNLLFGSSPTIWQVARILNKWTDPRYEIIVVRKGGDHDSDSPNE